MEVYRSRVYTDRPKYADFEPAEKFQAILGIIMTRLRQHPKAICSYSGGADSDILIDLIETAREIVPSLPKVDYVFFNTGLEMKAIKDHVRETAEKYNLNIIKVKPKESIAQAIRGRELTKGAMFMDRPEVNIVQATRRFGLPFVSKIMSQGLGEWQKKNVPLAIAEEYEQAEDKQTKRQELKERYPNCETVINFLCCCNSDGEPRPNIQLVINSSKYMRDFIAEYPPDFQISSKCCDYCKKHIAHKVQKDYEMIITGERRDEGGMRSVPRKDNTAMCFTETSSGQYRLRPLYYVSDSDKAWYKEWKQIRYSDAYEVYGLTRTGCCGCPISYKAVEDLQKIGKYEPNLEKAAWSVFGKSYEYRKKYNEYKRIRMIEEKQERENIEGQMSIFDLMGEQNAAINI